MSKDRKRNRTMGGSPMAKQSEVQPQEPASKVNRTAAPDAISAVRSPQGFSYGQNKFPTPSSIEPGKATRSALAQNMVDTIDDKVLAGVIAGHRRGDLPVSDWQTRYSGPADGAVDVLGKGNSKPVEPHPHMVRHQDPSILARKDQLPKNIDEAAEENPVRNAGN